jgi:hypothetical protein
MILTGAQRKWPPLQPPVQCGLYYSGYPGVGTRQMSPAAVCFGAAPGSGVATRVNEKYIAIQFEREYWQAAFGGELTISAG